MKFRIFLVLLVGFMMGACSSSVDAVQDPINLIPDNGGLDTDAPGDENDNTAVELKPQSQPSDVPEISSGSYHGKLDGKVGEALEFKLIGGEDERVVDIEFNPSAAATVAFSDMSVFVVGQCDSWNQQFLWMEVDAEGWIMDQTNIGWFDSWDVEKGKRYIFRISYSGTEGCDTVETLVGISANQGA